MPTTETDGPGRDQILAAVCRVIVALAEAQFDEPGDREVFIAVSRNDIAILQRALVTTLWPAAD